ncbi:hypothetical protein WG66_014300 [Moniliophthora roreri]|nr:hypothetical protein WG66_014300 [Moniliophthora roreri]
MKTRRSSSWRFSSYPGHGFQDSSKSESSMRLFTRTVGSSCVHSVSTMENGMTKRRPVECCRSALFIEPMSWSRSYQYREGRAAVFTQYCWWNNKLIPSGR